MKLSQKTRYALRALEVLVAEHGKGPILISELADREKIPKKFLELILLELKNQGILHSKKGKGGGYFLRKDPNQVTLGQVIRIFDGPLAPLPCVSESAHLACAECADESTCATRAVMKEVRDAMAKILDATTLAGLHQRGRELEDRKRGLMYYI
jgi:Rrf2 family protein